MVVVGELVSSLPGLVLYWGRAGLLVGGMGPTAKVGLIPAWVATYCSSALPGLVLLDWHGAGIDWRGRRSPF